MRNFIMIFLALIISVNSFGQITPATFPDPFDSLTYIGDGKINGKFVQFTGTTNVLPFTVTYQVGRFMVNVMSKRYSKPKLYEFKKQWQVRDSVTIAKGVVSVLNKNVFTAQARILIPLAATTTTPSITIKQGTTTVANFPLKQLSGYWYVYLNASLLINRTVDLYGFGTGVFQMKNPVAGESVVIDVALSTVDSTKTLFVPK